MKKLWMGCLVAFLSLGVLSGCSSGNQKEKLTYLAWNLGTEEENNAERQMLERYQEENDIEIEVLTPPVLADGEQQSYDEYLGVLAANNEMPDVFMWANVTDTVLRNWAADVTELTKDDAEFNNVVDAVRDGSYVNDKVYALPYAMNIMGMIINHDIYEELNVTPLTFGYTLDDLMAAMQSTTTNKYKAVDSLAIEEWGPFVMNSNIGAGTFDGEKYNFSSEEFARSISIYQEVISRGYSGSGSFIDIEEFFPEGIDQPWNKGYIGLSYGGSWAVNNLINGDLEFDGDFIGLPEGKSILVPDYIFVSASSQKKEEAYDLAKFMGFGEQGLEARKAITEETGTSAINGIPLMAGANEEIDQDFLSMYDDYPGFQQVYQAMYEHPENTTLEGYKVIPGFTQSRFEADTGVLGTVNDEEKSLTMGELIVAIINGDIQLADYSSEMDRIANDNLKIVSDQIKEK